MSLAPPPENCYNSREELLTAVKSWASANGYAVVIAGSSNAIDKAKIYLKCDHGGRYRNKHGVQDNQRCRATGSRLTACPFSVVGNCVQDVWHLRIRNSHHNHEASTTSVAHPSLRRLNEEQLEDVRQLTRVGAPPRTIVAALRGDATETPVPVIARDVYNARVQIRTEALAGQTPLQALVGHLEAEQFVWNVNTTPQGHLTHLFFASHQALRLFESYPEVLLLDCTYKTNRFKMPLLNIVGFTALNTTFYLSFVFLKGEQEDDYVWALQQLKNKTSISPKVMITDWELALMNAIKTVFPNAQHLLCQWHIQKNILAKCKR